MLDIDVMPAIVLCYNLLRLRGCLMQQEHRVVPRSITSVALMVKTRNTYSVWLETP